MNHIINILIAAIGGYDDLIGAFFIITVLDFTLELLVDLYQRKYRLVLKTIRRNIYRILAYIISIMIVVQLDRLLGDTSVFKDTLITFTIANEMLMMIDNLSLLGVPFPKMIKDSLEVLKKNKNDK